MTHDHDLPEVFLGFVLFRFVVSICYLLSIHLFVVVHTCTHGFCLFLLGIVEWDLFRAFEKRPHMYQNVRFIQ